MRSEGSKDGGNYNMYGFTNCLIQTGKLIFECETINSTYQYQLPMDYVELFLTLTGSLIVMYFVMIQLAKKLAVKTGKEVGIKAIFKQLGIPIRDIGELNKLDETGLRNVVVIMRELKPPETAANNPLAALMMLRGINQPQPQAPPQPTAVQ